MVSTVLHDHNTFSASKTDSLPDKLSPKQGFSGECQHHLGLVKNLGCNWTQYD